MASHRLCSAASGWQTVPEHHASDPIRPGITPFLPKTVKQRSGLALSGFGMDLWRKRILYAFGFTRNNAG